jgi:hypothetical protein
VDNAITRLQRHAVPAADKLGQRFMQLHINRLGIGRGMAERLHNQISGKIQAGQIGKLIARHSSGGILRTDGGDSRLAVLSWSDPQRRRLSHYFLRQRKAGGGGCRRFRPAENVGGRKVQ